MNNKERFDLVFGLGAACSCSRMLREYGLQFASFPLDWVGDPCLDASKDLRLTTDVVLGGFSDWFAEGNLVRAPQYDSPKHLGYFDKCIRLYFAHDFELYDNFHACYPFVSEKYKRRIARFFRLFGSAKKILIVWIADPRGCGELGEGDLKECVEAFHRAYPSKRFKLLASNCVHGVNPENAQVLRGDGYECFSFDYRLVTTGEPTWDVRTELFAPIFGKYDAVDYRTRAEKKANARREKARAYDKFKSTSVFDYLVTKLQFKVYRHLKRRLERKGVLAELEGPAGHIGFKGERSQREDGKNI